MKRAARVDLERVAVDEYDLAVAPDHEAVLVHVSDDVTMAVYSLERGGNVACHVQQEIPRNLRVVLAAVSRAVDHVDGVLAGHLGHEEPDHRSAATRVQCFLRPSHVVEELNVGGRSHEVQLRLFLWVRSPVDRKSTRLNSSHHSIS